MKTNTRILIFFILIITFLSTVKAQEAIVDTLLLDEITVTGSKNAVSRNNVPLTVSVITQRQIEESSESALLPVLSQQVPGVFITERGIAGFGVSNGSAGAINIRGIGGNPNTQTLILLNGNPQFMGIMGHPLPDAYIASDVERVEIIRGPASTLYGSNAMGGVINILTKEQRQDGFKANARFMQGSYATQKYMLNGGFKERDFNVFASYNHDKTDGHRPSSDFSIHNGYIRMGYNINTNLILNADFSLSNFKASDPGQENLIAGETIEATRGMGAVSLSNQFENTNGSVRFFYNFGEHDITDGFHSTDQNYGIVLFQSINLFQGNTITIGTDYKKYGGMSENVKARNGLGMVFGDDSIWELAGYGYIQQILFDRLILNAGLRLENNSIFGNELVPTGGLVYHLTNTTTLKASVAKGFRSPTIRELYLFAPANENLKPETMVNYEVGVFQKLLNNSLTIELTGYKADGENLIKTVMTSTGPQNQNTGKFSNTGIEFAGNFKPTTSFSLQANYSYISMDEPIISTPEQNLFIGGTYMFNKFSVNLSLQHVSGLYTLVSPVIAKESYTLLNTRVSYTLNNYLNFFVKVENLTNQKYYINYAYPMPGTVVFGGINLSY